MEFCELLKKRRSDIGKTMEDIALEVGVSKATVQRWESGEIKNVRRDKIQPLANALHTTPAYLMGWDEDPTDWETIGNKEGIYPPKGYSGDYKDFVKSKIIQEQDNLIDDYYDLFHEAIKYLKNLNCQILDENAEPILVTIPNGEQYSVTSDDLISNYKTFGSSKPGIKKLLQKRALKDSEEEYSPEIRAAARGMMDLSPEDQKTAIDMINFLAKKSKGAKED